MSDQNTSRTRYDQAARRHFADAELLRASNRRANADHLYGVASECALLGVLGTSPTAVRQLFDSSGAVHDRFRKHIDVLWGVFCREGTYYRLGDAVGRLNSAFPGQRSPGERPRPSNPFRGWSVDQRYLSDAAVAEEIPDEALDRHRRAADVCLKLLDDKRKNGAPR